MDQLHRTSRLRAAAPLHAARQDMHARSVPVNPRILSGARSGARNWSGRSRGGSKRAQRTWAHQTCVAALALSESAATHVTCAPRGGRDRTVGRERRMSGYAPLARRCPDGARPPGVGGAGGARPDETHEAGHAARDSDDEYERRARVGRVDRQLRQRQLHRPRELGPDASRDTDELHLDRADPEPDLPLHGLRDRPQREPLGREQPGVRAPRPRAHRRPRRPTCGRPPPG